MRTLPLKAMPSCEDFPKLVNPTMTDFSPSPSTKAASTHPPEEGKKNVDSLFNHGFSLVLY